ncbi:hypothetical protein LJR267_002891 [Paraburkholderia hospita]|uniref:hypothetical protein n=1 Tax=Paraburkholderia hospita TaxID=169430 RepID=UPI003ECD0077
MTAVGFDAVEHYLCHGRNEGRRFDAWGAAYRALSDIREADLTGHIGTQRLLAGRRIIEDVIRETGFIKPDEVCEAIGFTSAMDSKYIAPVANFVIIPITNLLYEIDLFTEAERLAHVMLTVYGHRISTEDEFLSYVQAWAPAATDAGRRFSRKLSKTRISSPTRTSPTLTTVGFVTKGSTIDVATLNHILPICRELSVRHGSDIRAIVYVLEAGDDGLQTCNDALKFKFVDRDGGTLSSYAKLKGMMSDDSIQIACYVHAFDAVYFLFGMRLAPIQMQFSQYLHPIPSGTEIDEFMTWGTPTSMHQPFAGRPWRVVPSCLADHPVVAADQAIMDIRQSVAGSARTVLATFARTEKVNQPGFLATVIRILKRHPECVFLWTGQMEHPEVVRAFQNSGIIDRTRFIGWVDTRLYSKVIDVLLDSFPLANGITALHAMAEGVPVASIWSATSLIGRDLLPMLNDTEDIPLPARTVVQELKIIFSTSDGASAACITEDDYVNFASLLIEDTAFRDDVGRKFSALFRLLYSNESVMADIFVDHVRDISRKHGLQ